MQRDQERRNGELRLESFLNGLDGSALTVSAEVYEGKTRS